VRKHDLISTARAVRERPSPVVPDVDDLVGHDFEGRRVPQAVHVGHNRPTVRIDHLKPRVVVVQHEVDAHRDLLLSARRRWACLADKVEFCQGSQSSGQARVATSPSTTPTSEAWVGCLPEAISVEVKHV